MALLKITLVITCLRCYILSYYYINFSMRNTSLLLSFIILPFLAKSAVMAGQTIKGCAKYFTNDYDELRCIRCNFGMGLTDSNTCEFCKPGQIVVGLYCVKRNITTTAPSPSVSASANKTDSSPTLTAANSSIKTKQNEAAKPQVSNATPTTSNSFVPQAVSNNQFSSHSVDFFSLGNDTSQNILDTEQNVSNCLKFSTDSLICLICQPNYTLTKTNQCILQSNIQQNNQIISANPKLQNKTQTPISVSNIGNQNRSLPLNAPNLPVTLSSPSSSSVKTQNEGQNMAQIPVTSTKASEQKQNLSKTVPITNSTAVVHKYPKYPFCFDYDGSRCWACVPGYLLNLIIDQCIPYVKPPDLLANSLESQNSNTQTEDASNQVTTSANSKKVNVSDNCNVFNEEINVCEECFRNYFLNKQTQLCEAVNKLCRTYDPDTGFCLTCYIKYSLAADGKCKLAK